MQGRVYLASQFLLVPGLLLALPLFKLLSILLLEIVSIECLLLQLFSTLLQVLLDQFLRAEVLYVLGLGLFLPPLDLHFMLNALQLVLLF